MNKIYLIVAINLFFAGSLKAQIDPPGTIPQMLGQFKTMPKDTGRLRLMLNIAFAYVLKPGSEKNDLDSAFLLVGQAKAANEQFFHDPRIAGLCDLMYANTWKEKGDNQQGKQYAQWAVNAFQQQYDRLDWAYAAVRLAGFYHYDIHHEDSIRIKLYLEALPVFDSLGIKDKQERVRELAGDCFIENGYADQALPLLLTALHLDTTLPNGDPRYLYTLLGTAYNALADQQTAINYGYKAIRLEEAHKPQERSLVTAYNRLGVIYNAINNYDNSINCFLKAMDVALRLKDTSDIRVVGLNLVNGYRQASIPKVQMALDTLNWLVKRYPPVVQTDSIQQDLIYVMVYAHLKDTTGMSRYGRELISIYPRTSPNSYERLYTLNGLAHYYQATRQFDQLSISGTEMFATGMVLRVPVAARDALRMFYLADSAKGDWHAAARDYQNYIRMRDSLNDVTHNRQIAGLKVEFDTENKDKDIQTLKQTQQLNQAALHQAGLARNAIIGASILLLILLGVAINRYRLKQRSNHQLNRLLGEKEWLVKEIHHRVKNNLQLAMSLLNTQSHYIDNEKAQAAIQQSRNRMYAMSLIHQRLYQVDNLETIDMSQYIPELISYIRDSVEERQHIAFDVDIQPLRLDVSQAVPLGLILNEAITNSIKYAFRGRNNGLITIGLERDLDSRQVQLRIADNGIGLPRDFNLDASSSMGMKLIETLVAQLEGNLQLINQGGLSLMIRFNASTSILV